MAGMYLGYEYSLNICGATIQEMLYTIMVRAFLASLLVYPEVLHVFQMYMLVIVQEPL